MNWMSRFLCGATYTICLVAVNPIAILGASDEALNRINIKNWEGVDSVQVNTEALYDLLVDIIESRGKYPSFEVLAQAASETTKKDISDTLFVLGLLSAGVSEDPVQVDAALEALQGSELRLTYMDNLGAQTSKPQLLDNSYAWLVNNTTLIIPREFVVAYPEIIAKATPYWFATRDGYFNIDKKQSITVFSEAEYEQWFSLLEDIESPAKDIWLGSKRNAKFKRLEVYRGLMIYSPEYFISFAIEEDKRSFSPNLSIPCWGRLGTYEFFKVQEYESAKSKFISVLSESLSEDLGFSADISGKAAWLFISAVENEFVGTSPSSEICQSNELIAHEQGLKETVEQFEYDVRSLRVLGTTLSLNAPDLLPEFLRTLDDLEAYKAADEIRNFAVVIAQQKDPSLLKINRPVWGEFNKTPLMYAAQFNQADTINWIITVAPSLIDVRTKSGGYNAPSIYGRTALTYTAEYSDFELISTMINASSDEVLNLVDSNGRNIFHYLARNQLLDDGQRSDLVGILERRAIKVFRPTFSCWRATTQYELFACSMKEYADLDIELNNSYQEAMNRMTLQDADALRRDQRKWLRDVQNSLVNSYNSTEKYASRVENRISILQEL